jgi:dihydroorotase
MDRLSLIRPDDWHLHLRDGPQMADVLPDTARRFARAIVMPNLRTPVRTTQEALAYRGRIFQAMPENARFEPLMTLYLTDDTPPEEIALARRSGQVHAVKLYPAGATTHSDSGVTRISRCFHTLEKMQEQGMPLLVHGEVTAPEVDVFDREAVFLEEVLGPLLERFPGLKVVLEHITTRQAVHFVEVTGANVAATITAHHLLLNRNALFQGGVRSSSAPTAHRTRVPPRRRPAAARASTPRTRRSSCTRSPSRRPARSTSWRISRADSARASTACRRTPTA